MPELTRLAQSFIEEQKQEGADDSEGTEIYFGGDFDSTVIPNEDFPDNPSPVSGSFPPSNIGRGEMTFLKFHTKNKDFSINVQQFELDLFYRGAKPDRLALRCEDISCEISKHSPTGNSFDFKVRRCQIIEILKKHHHHTNSPDHGNISSPLKHSSFLDLNNFDELLFSRSIVEFGGFETEINDYDANPNVILSVNQNKLDNTLTATSTLHVNVICQPITVYFDFLLLERVQTLFDSFSQTFSTLNRETPPLSAHSSAPSTLEDSILGYLENVNVRTELHKKISLEVPLVRVIINLFKDPSCDPTSTQLSCLECDLSQMKVTSSLIGKGDAIFLIDMESISGSLISAPIPNSRKPFFNSQFKHDVYSEMPTPFEIQIKQASPQEMGCSSSSNPEFQQGGYNYDYLSDSDHEDSPANLDTPPDNSATGTTCRDNEIYSSPPLSVLPDILGRGILHDNPPQRPSRSNAFGAPFSVYKTQSDIVTHQYWRQAAVPDAPELVAFRQHALNSSSIVIHIAFPSLHFDIDPEIVSFFHGVLSQDTQESKSDQNRDDNHDDDNVEDDDGQNDLQRGKEKELSLTKLVLNLTLTKSDISFSGFQITLEDVSMFQAIDLYGLGANILWCSFDNLSLVDTVTHQPIIYRSVEQLVVPTGGVFHATLVHHHDYLETACTIQNLSLQYTQESQWLDRLLALTDQFSFSSKSSFSKTKTGTNSTNLSISVNNLCCKYTPPEQFSSRAVFVFDSLKLVLEAEKTLTVQGCQLYLFVIDQYLCSHSAPHTPELNTPSQYSVWSSLGFFPVVTMPSFVLQFSPSSKKIAFDHLEFHLRLSPDLISVLMQLSFQFLDYKGDNGGPVPDETTKANQTNENPPILNMFHNISSDIDDGDEDDNVDGFGGVDSESLLFSSVVSEPSSDSILFQSVVNEEQDQDQKQEQEQEQEQEEICPTDSPSFSIIDDYEGMTTSQIKFFDDNTWDNEDPQPNVPISNAFQPEGDSKVRWFSSKHFIHCDDGDYVQTPPIPSSPQLVNDSSSTNSSDRSEAFVLRLMNIRITVQLVAESIFNRNGNEHDQEVLSEPTTWLGSATTLVPSDEAPIFASTISSSTTAAFDSSFELKAVLHVILNLYDEFHPISKKLTLLVQDDFALVDKTFTSELYRILGTDTAAGLDSNLPKPPSVLESPFDNHFRINLAQHAALKVDLEVLPKVPLPPSETLQYEHRLLVDIQPLRIYFNETVVRFVIEFLANLRLEDPEFYPNSPPWEKLPWFSYAFISSILIRLDYKAMHLEFREISKGNLLELLNLFPVENIHFQLPQLRVGPVGGGLGPLLSLIVNEWIVKLSKKEGVFQFAKGVRPVRSIVNVSGGLANLLLFPLKQHGNEHLLHGIRRGAKQFFQPVGQEILGLTNRLNQNTARIISGAAHLLEKETKGKKKPTPTTKPLFVPENIKDGVEFAISHAIHHFKAASDTVIAIPLATFEKEGKRGYLKEVVQAVPIAFLHSAMGVSESLSSIFRGLQIYLDPDNYQRLKTKYKTTK